MPQGPSSDHVAKILKKHGFVFVQQRGSHAKYRSPAGIDVTPARTVIVPTGRRDLAIGTFRSICRRPAYNRRLLNQVVQRRPDQAARGLSPTGAADPAALTAVSRGGPDATAQLLAVG